MQNGCQFHIKFHEESKNELYFNLLSYPKAEVKAEWNFEQSLIKSNKIGNRYSWLGSTDCTSLLVLTTFWQTLPQMSPGRKAWCLAQINAYNLKQISQNLPKLRQYNVTHFQFQTCRNLAALTNCVLSFVGPA